MLLTVEADFLSDVPKLSIYNRLISADNVGGLVCISDREGVLEGSGGDLMLSYKGPVYTVDLGSRVNDCGGVDVFHGERGVTVLFPHRSILLFIHTHCLLTWRGRRHYTNTSLLFIRTLSSFFFFDLSMDLANS